MTIQGQVQRRFVLTGARRDFTGQLGAYLVEKGRILVQGVAKDVLAAEHYIALMWQGFPEGDPRIQEHEDAITRAAGGTVEGDSNGQGGVQAGGSQPNGQGDVPGGEQPGGAGSDSTADVGSVAAGAAPGATDAGSADGDGSTQGVTDEKTGDPKVAAAVAQLDHSNDSHWTKEGKAMLAAVEGFLGRTGLTRADVEAAAPGLKRQAPTA